MKILFCNAEDRAPNYIDSNFFFSEVLTKKGLYKLMKNGFPRGYQLMLRSMSFQRGEHTKENLLVLIRKFNVVVSTKDFERADLVISQTFEELYKIEVDKYGLVRPELIMTEAPLLSAAEARELVNQTKRLNNLLKYTLCQIEKIAKRGESKYTTPDFNASDLVKELKKLGYQTLVNNGNLEVFW
jgi:hypothetical protein